MKQEDKLKLKEWADYKADIRNSTPVETLSEAEIQKKKDLSGGTPHRMDKILLPEIHEIRVSTLPDKGHQAHTRQSGVVRSPLMVP